MVPPSCAIKFSGQHKEHGTPGLWRAEACCDNDISKSTPKFVVMVERWHWTASLNNEQGNRIYCLLTKLALHNPCQCASTRICYIVDIPRVDVHLHVVTIDSVRYGCRRVTGAFLLLDHMITLHLTTARRSIHVLLKPWWHTARARRTEVSRTMSTHLHGRVGMNMGRPAFYVCLVWTEACRNWVGSVLTGIRHWCINSISGVPVKTRVVVPEQTILFYLGR